MLRATTAILILLALATFLVPSRLLADDAAPSAGQADTVTAPAPAPDVFKPPPRGAPAHRVGAATRDLSGQRRVALVVGNGAYQHLPRLENPASDAQLIAKTLRSLGFQLIGGQAQTDLDRTEFERVIRQFGKELTSGSVGLFYYAGHGVQFQGANFLVPVEANPATAADVDFELIDANTVLKQMEVAESDLKLVILDACRNNPFGGRGLRDAGGGLAPMHAPRGTLISYATQPGNVAMDGTTGHSPYTVALAEAMRRPGLPLLDVFNEVGLAVDQTTRGRQQPWWSSSPLEGVFFFLGPTTVNITPPAPTQPSPEAETVFWQSIAQSNNPADFDEYLRQYPQGRFAGLAHNRLAALRPPPPTQEPISQQHGAAPGPPPQQPLSDQHETARQLQTELQRVGCFGGKIDGIWDSRSADAVKRFNQHAHMSLSAEAPSPESLTALHANTGRVCPLTCPRGQAASGDHCIALHQPRTPTQREGPPSYVPSASAQIVSSSTTSVSANETSALLKRQSENPTNSNLAEYVR